VQTNWVSLAIALLVVCVSLGFQSWPLYIQGSEDDEKKKKADFIQAANWTRNVAIILFLLAWVFIIFMSCIIHAGNLYL
jgi:hypothetical protein